MRLGASILLLTLILCPGAAAAPGALEKLLASIPRSTDQCTSDRAAQVASAARGLEQRIADLAWELPEEPRAVLDAAAALVDVRKQVDAARAEFLKLRLQFTGSTNKEPTREQLRYFLGIEGQLVDLSGRLRYTLRDALDNAAYVLDPDPRDFEQLVEMLTQHRDSVGAAAVAYALFDPPPGSDSEPFPESTKQKTLGLIAAARNEELLPILHDFLNEQLQKETSNNAAADRLLIDAALAIRDIGLPQQLAAEPQVTDPEVAPLITASQLRQVLEKVAVNRLDRAHQQSRAALLQWLDEREKKGIVSPTYRFGQYEFQPGDWLLLRNPSPYNRFTDLSPGLFTHVGIVTEQLDEEGRRRIVAVDLPERGATIPATNVEQFVNRSLHFMILRHRDPQVASQLATAAAETIGNESQFDLQFETDRMRVEAGQSLRGRRIHSYCAGFLLVCAQVTGQPREEFFPIEEFPRSEKCQRNLQKLGLSLGKRFVSPTGPLFSKHFEIVGQREPMYDPGREIKEAVFDHFAESMAQRDLVPSPDLFQSLRLQAAQLSRTNPWLARALAQANNVSPDLDLESAAKAAAVVETLDQIADSCWKNYEQARLAIMAGSDHELRAQTLTAEQQRRWLELRRRHSDLLMAWLDGNLTPRELRQKLVADYSAEGRQRIDARFFSPKR